jgi:histidinol-phosphate aminotransferase
MLELLNQNFSKRKDHTMIFHKYIYNLDSQPRTENFSFKRLHLNENPFPFPDELAVKIKKELNFSSSSFYADTFSKKLAAALSEYTGVAEKYIQIGNGGDDIIYTLLGGLCHKEDKVLTLEPSYYYYDVAIKSHGLKREKIYLNDNLKFSEENFIEKANHNDVKLIFLCNPNNPTGHLIDDQTVLNIINNIPDNKLLVLDEAYYEFSNKSFYTKVMDKKNLLILRTMSKAYSFAGIHVGYILGHPDLIKNYERFKNPYSVNHITQTAAAVTLENKNIFINKINELNRIKKDFCQKAEKAGFTVYPSYTNFVLIRPGNKDISVTQEILNRLNKNKIMVRPLTDNFADALRISIGNKETMDNLFDILT